MSSSGAGKSSIISKVTDRPIETMAIGNKSGRGKHTTTYRQTYFAKQGAIIIDKPGSREDGTVKFGVKGSEVFAEIQEIATGCKFNNCAHLGEQGCAMLEAVGSGKLEKSRYEKHKKR